MSLDDFDSEIDVLIKVVIVGDTSVGKTNLLSRFINNTFNENSRNTIGVDFSVMDMNINNKKVKVQFWDTAGQEKYRSIGSAYYKNAQGVIVTYDITRKNSFDHINEWMTEIAEQGEPDSEVLLIGNKIDLEEHRQIKKEDAENFAKDKKVFFMEVSAKTNQDQCVEKAFTILIKEIMKKTEERNSQINPSKGGSAKKLEGKRKKIESKKDESCC